MRTKSQTNTHKTTIQLDQKLYRLLKLKAWQQNKSLKQLINESLADTLNTEIMYKSTSSSVKPMGVSDEDDLLSYGGSVKPKTKPENYSQVRKKTMKHMANKWAKK